MLIQGLEPVPLTIVLAPPEDLPLTPHFLHFLNSSQILGFCQCLEYYNSLLLLKIFVCVMEIGPRASVRQVFYH